MSKKGKRNQELQPSKAEKAYGGYLPSVEGEGRAEVPTNAAAQWHPEQRKERNLDIPQRN